jgi:hypothetical protein
MDTDTGEVLIKMENIEKYRRGKSVDTDAKGEWAENY